MNPTCVQVLIRTKEVLKQRGRTRFQFEDKDGRVCLFGAVNVVIFGEPNRPTMTHRLAGLRLDVTLILERAVREIPNHGVPWPVSFNDWSGTTDEEVFVLLDKAIELASE